MFTITTDSAPISAEDLAAFSSEHPRWHAWLDSGNHLNATRVFSRDEMRSASLAFRSHAGSGITLDADSLSSLGWKIRDWELDWAAALHMEGAA